MANEWEQFFDQHAPTYMTNSFTADTVAEVDFALETLELLMGAHLLDIGCGTGRHAIELAQRGYLVTGVDISKGMLAQAKQAADEAGVAERIEFIHSDAAQFTVSPESFDGAICLCEGAFSLLGAADDPIYHDLDILRNVQRALKPGGRFILTCLNGMRYFRLFTQEDVISGRFDILNTVENSTYEVETEQERVEIHGRERGYVPSELRLMCEVAGFKVEHIWGGTAGLPKRRPPELDEMELMAVLQKLG